MNKRLRAHRMHKKIRDSFFQMLQRASNALFTGVNFSMDQTVSSFISCLAGNARLPGATFTGPNSM